MSFGAMAGWQAVLLVTAAVAAGVWLFLRKVRPPRVAVPSLALWHRVLDQPRAATWWERIRRAVSLAAAAIVTAALALAITRPAPRAGAAAGGPIVVVLDSSWSMLGRTSSGRTRWDQAVAEARALLASAAGSRAALATTADGLIEGPADDVALLESTLDSLSPAGSGAARWPRVPGAVVHFLTDGAVHRTLDPATVVHSVFEPAPNVGILAFAARTSGGGQSDGEAYLELANYAAGSQRVHLEIRRGADLIVDRQVDLAAGELARQTVPLGRDGDPRLRARISAPEDALVADDEAVAWFAAAERVPVTLVSENPGALGLALERNPSVHATFVAPSAYAPVREGILIFDRWLPAAAPDRPALCLAPPAAAWLGTPGDSEDSPRWNGTASHPIVLGVDLQTLVVEQARRYSAAGLLPVAPSENGTPLLYVADRPDRRLVVTTFSAAEPKFAFSPGFPVLMGSAVEWLAHPHSGTNRPSGLAFFDDDVAQVVAPNGRPLRLVPAGEVRAALLRAPGLYVEHAGGAASVFAVNLGGPETSDLMRTSLPAGAAAPVVRQSGLPWWTWCAALVLLLLTAEWWTWNRRVTV